MPSREILEYFDATEARETRDDLKLGVALVEGSRIAVDCGCGAGSDIAFLRVNGFTVHAFDIEPEAVARCQKRFGGDSNVKLSQESFSTFHYPRASLIVADASLFFCSQDEFTDTFTEHRKSGTAPGGNHHQWHIYSVVARKGFGNSIQPTANISAD